MRRRNNLILAAVLLALPLVVTAESKNKTMVEGEIVCMHCYEEDGKRGAEQADCIKSCADRGMRLALLTDDGKIHPLAPAVVETKTTKAADFVLRHALMCIEMPLMAISEFTPYSSNVRDLPEVEFRRRAKEPKKKMLGVPVSVTGTFRENNESGTFYYSDVTRL